ncbi:MAG: TlpA family protein disulfide reductase [Deltaproteobacteria bacterium]|nr:TlpA family protein disulfide reductase [Deltaproteobacteria bacterium]
MKRSLISLVIAAVLAATVVPLTPAAAAEATALKGKRVDSNGLLAVGSEALPFTLKDLDGNTVSLEQFRGRKAVLLTFWSFFCGPCREEIPLLDQILKKYQDQGFEMLAINLDGPKLAKAVRRYMDSNGFSFRVLWEEIEGVSYKTADAYGVAGTPSLVLVDKEGKVLWTHVGREEPEKIEAVIRKALGKG